jgi:hypothetical protein
VLVLAAALLAVAVARTMVDSTFAAADAEARASKPAVMVTGRYIDSRPVADSWPDDPPELGSGPPRTYVQAAVSDDMTHSSLMVL